MNEQGKYSDLNISLAHFGELVKLFTKNIKLVVKHIISFPMKKIVVLVALISIATSCTSQHKPDIKIISMETLKADAVGKDVQLIDVRTPKEYEAGHIDDAINIDFLSGEHFTNEVNKLDKTKPVYIYCQMGGRSKKASEKLKNLGFTTIFDYGGGYGEWSQKNN